MTTPLAVSRFRVQNFKAIRDSGLVRFTPLTAFIGNNGAGKSSLVEALEILKTIMGQGLNEAMTMGAVARLRFAPPLHGLCRSAAGVPFRTKRGSQENGQTKPGSGVWYDKFTPLGSRCKRTAGFDSWALDD